jgi:hypothetical protein
MTGGRQTVAIDPFDIGAVAPKRQLDTARLLLELAAPVLWIRSRHRRRYLS